MGKLRVGSGNRTVAVGNHYNRQRVCKDLKTSIDAVLDESDG